MRDTGAELLERLEAGPVILDGATGTELTRRGVDTPLPLWSAGALRSHPDVVQAIHREYVAAGAEIVVANTFRTNPRTLAAAGLMDSGPELNRVAVQLARAGAAEGLSLRRGEVSADLRPRDAAPRPPAVWVAASLAPVEDCYHPERVPDEPTLRREHGRMAEWLAAAEPDLIWIETMNTAREVTAAAGAAAACGLPFVVSIVANESGDLLSGERLEPVVEAAVSLGAIAIGLNCIPPSGLTRHLPRLRAATDRPLIAYGHIGNPDPICGWSFSQEMEPQRYAAAAAEWVRLGAQIVGGCCGTTPDHVAAIASRIGITPA